MPEATADARERVLSGAYECIARAGMAKTTVDDVASASGVSRATIYRLFPGGKDEVLRDTVGWEMDRFFLHLGEELGDAADFPTFLERALPLARRELREHAVLQKVLETEPDRLNALITVQQHRVIGAIAAYFLPPARARSRRGARRSARRPRAVRGVRRPHGALADLVPRSPRSRRPRRGAPPGPPRAPRGRADPMRQNLVYRLRR
jgi:AcrR family transcriptional regulator